MNKSSPSYSVYLDKTAASPSGVIETQPEGRASLPPAEAVREATEEPGACQRLMKVQTGENRVAINSYVAKCKEHGPNN